MKKTFPQVWVLCAIILLLYGEVTSAQLAVIQSNDNLVPGGNQSGNSLILNLVVEEGMWYPGGTEKPGAPMWAFGEASRELQVPGPLVRVKQGTLVDVTITNHLAGEDIHVYGLQDRPSVEQESLYLREGETRRHSFQLNEPGVYYYWASSVADDLNSHVGIESTLSGIIVVDPSEGQIEGRFFVLGEGSSIPGKREHSINGRSFPNTERMGVEIGKDTIWHFINTTFAEHPLHLHGTFFQVTNRGTMTSYDAIEPGQIHDEVTSAVGLGEVMTMRWHTERPGNWLFHCHVSAHVAADNGRLSSGDDFEADSTSGLHEMGGMTLAITAVSETTREGTLDPAREISMQLNRIESYFGDNVGYATAFNEDGDHANTPVAPGPLLVLEKDQSVAINIINGLDETTSIHWHGMELESYFDGVAGFSGVNGSITPAIGTGDSFVARMTPPRAGTYIYHTHMDDRSQLVKGLYGALIVESPEYPFDPEIDKVFVLGLGGDAVRTAARVEGLVINGSKNSSMELAGIKEYRLRLINITANNAELEISLVNGRELQEWTLIGKDGAALEHSQHRATIADRHPLSVGETFDFAWQPPEPGDYWLEVRRDDGEWMGQVRLSVTE